MLGPENEHENDRARLGPNGALRAFRALATVRTRVARCSRPDSLALARADEAAARGAYEAAAHRDHVAAALGGIGRR